MLQKMNAANAAKYELQYQRKQKILVQMCCDAAVIAANDVFCAGPVRVKRFISAMASSMNEISTMILDAAKDDPDIVYAKAKLDERLKQICGDEFKEWDERYK